MERRKKNLIEIKREITSNYELKCIGTRERWRNLPLSLSLSLEKSKTISGENFSGISCPRAEASGTQIYLTRGNDIERRRISKTRVCETSVSKFPSIFQARIIHRPNSFSNALEKCRILFIASDGMELEQRNFR